MNGGKYHILLGSICQSPEVETSSAVGVETSSAVGASAATLVQLRLQHSAADSAPGQH